MMLMVISFLFLATILIGVPIAFGMGVAGATWILFFEGLDPSILARRMYHSMGSFALLSIPLFIMIGFLAERAALLPELVRWLQLLLGQMRGGMAYINVCSSMLFAGVSGTAVSDIASLGRVEIQLMRRAGYPLNYSAALTAASSIAGPIIPPSVAMVVYALAAGHVSIGGMFMAGAVPGLLICGGLLIMAWFHARRGGYGLLLERPGMREILGQTVRVLPLLSLPAIIIGGIVSGIFTVTESAAIGVSYTILIGFLFTRKLRLGDIYDATLFSAIISSVLGMLMGAGVIVSWILTRNQVTQNLADYLISLTADPTAFLALVAISLIVIGMVMDATAVIIALAPLLAPISAQYGIDPLHFGLVFILSCMVGLVTPPVGIVLFLTASIANTTLEALSRAIIPYVVWLFVVVAIIVYFPIVTLWLPRLTGF